MQTMCVGAVEFTKRAITVMMDRLVVNGYRCMHTCAGHERGCVHVLNGVACSLAGLWQLLMGSGARL